MEGYNDYVDSSKLYSQAEKAIMHANQRDKQNSRLSNRSSHQQDAKPVEEQSLDD